MRALSRSDLVCIPSVHSWLASLVCVVGWSGVVVVVVSVVDSVVVGEVSGVVVGWSSACSSAASSAAVSASSLVRDQL